MATLLRAAESEIQLRLNAEYVPKFAPELTLLFPRVETYRTPYGTDAEWLTLECDHPMRADTGLFVEYRIGCQHQYLLFRNGPEWARRRVETLMRLMLKKLSRKVMNALTAPQDVEVIHAKSLRVNA